MATTLADPEPEIQLGRRQGGRLLDAHGARIADVGADWPDRTRLEAEFTNAMIRTCDRFQHEIAYNPTAFRGMLAEHGGVEAASRLMTGPAAQSGLERLWQHGRLGESVEAHMLLPRFAPLFTERERRIARRRLEDHNFDVEAFLGRIGDERP